MAKLDPGTGAPGAERQTPPPAPTAANVERAPSKPRLTPRPGLKLVSARDLLTEPAPERRWLVPDWIPADDVTLMVGDGSTGKTTLALQLGLAVVCGDDWIGMTVAQGNVLFLSAEDSVDELHYRLEQSLKGRVLPDDHDLMLYTTVGTVEGSSDPVLARFERDGQIARRPLHRALVDELATGKYGLLIIDALGDVFGGNENDRGQVAQFCRMLQQLAVRFGCAVLVLAHPSKQAMFDNSGYAGSTHWNAGVKSRLLLKLAKDNPGGRVLTLEKSNRSQRGLEIQLEWRDGVFVKRDPNDVASRARAVEAERVFLMLLERSTAKGQNVSSKSGPTYAPSMFSKEAEGSAVGKERLKTAMGSLMAKGIIEQRVEGPPKRRRGVLRLTNGANRASNPVPTDPTPSNETSSDFQPEEDEMT